MSQRSSRGPLYVNKGTPQEINDVLRRIQNEIDEVRGLRGRVQTYDRVKVSAATEASDAVTLGEAVTVQSEQSVAGTKTFQVVAVKVVDTEGTLIHALGAKE